MRKILLCVGVFCLVGLLSFVLARAEGERFSSVTVGVVSGVGTQRIEFQDAEKKMHFAELTSVSSIVRGGTHVLPRDTAVGMMLVVAGPLTAPEHIRADTIRILTTPPPPQTP